MEINILQLTAATTSASLASVVLGNVVKMFLRKLFGGNNFCFNCYYYNCDYQWKNYYNIFKYLNFYKVSCQQLIKNYVCKL